MSADISRRIEPAEFEGVPVRISSPAGMTVDGFCFRCIVSMDVALEANRDVLADRRVVQSSSADTKERPPSQ